MEIDLKIIIGSGRALSTRIAWGIKDKLGTKFRLGANRMKIKFILLVLSILIVAAVWLGPYLFWDFIDYLGSSQYEDQVEMASPDGRYVAYGYHVIGGATVSDSTFVMIRTKGEALDYKKNDLLFVVDDLGPFKLIWKNNTELLIKYTPGPIYMQTFSWKDVSVKYISE